MMQKRTLYSLLIISFIVVFAASMSVANTVTIESKSNLPRCFDQQVEITADVTTAEVNAVECVFEITTASGCGFIQDLDLAIELPAGVLSTQVVQYMADGIAPDTIRFAAMRVDDGDGVLASGSHLLATLSFHTVDCCNGSVSIDNAVWDYANETCDITTQFVDAADGSVLDVDVVPGTVSIANQGPSIDAIADQELAWGETLSLTLTGDDPDLDNGCENLTFSGVTMPEGMTVNPLGALTWVTDGDDVCTHEVTVRVTDGCGAFADETFMVCVTNEAPTIECPAEELLVWAGEDLVVDPIGNDPDGGPHPLVYTLASTDFPGTITVDPATGQTVVATDFVAEQTGFFTACVTVTDSANVCDPCSPSNSDECCFTFEVRAFGVYIEKVHDQLQGQNTTVSIDMLGPDWNTWDIGGFNLLIAYDQTAMSFVSAVQGAFLDACGWEYFTYRQGADGNCGNGCPTGLVRLVGMAESNNGAFHPDCFNNDGNGETQLAELTFLVSQDYTLNCMLAPIKFFWIECGDNTFSDVGGDTLMMSRWVYDYFGDDGEDTYVYMGESLAMPSYTGADASCDVFTEKGEPVRVVDFFDGGIDIICKDSIDDAGDINMNGIAYEIADGVMFTNYFVEGLSAFSSHIEGSIAASDCNLDGVALTVADLVYLIRVVVGDANPYPKAAAEFTFTNDGVINVPQELGAAYFVYEGEVSPELLASNMVLSSRVEDGKTFVAVTPPVPATEDGIQQTFSGNVIRCAGDLVEVQFSDIYGNLITAKELPKNFQVFQNYPNPFNPTTTLSFALPTASDWTVEIFNVTGQKVDEFNGTSAAGNVDVVWDASNLASGVYLYKVTSNDNVATKKAILLK